MTTACAFLGWTEENIGLLRKLWAEGLSSGEIARELGEACNRNMVVGKIKRLGLFGQGGSRLSKRSATPKVKATKQTAVRKHPFAMPKPIQPSRHRFVRTDTVCPDPVPRSQCFDHADRATVALLELRSGLCRWPFGDSPFRFCGQPTTDPSNPGCAYCATHRALAYVPREPRRAA